MLSRNSTSFLINNMSTTYTHQKFYSAPTPLEIQVSHKLLYKPKIFDHLIKAYIPTPRCLLQSLKGSLELAYLLASLGSTKLFWLYCIQPFLTKTSKETCLDIHLPDFINAANANMIPTDFKHRYEWENLIVVNSLNLSENTSPQVELHRWWHYHPRPSSS